MSEHVLADRYEIIEQVGEGGMAVVYKAKDRLLNRNVAIKILKPEFIKDSTFVDSFKRESQAAGSISHPNIVNIYDVGREGNVHYIVMEYVEGRTLNKIIDEEAPLNYKRTINIAKQVAAALSHAHKNNIVHRDVKPHNILVTDDDVAKITDFGIAKAVTDTTLVGEPTAIMGSVHYFSPEQARGGYVDEKSDIYSLGIVMYEMLTGRVPFDADTPVAVAVKHMNVRPELPSKLVAGIPPGLEQIILKAIDKYQINRFKSAEDMYKALDNVNFITGIVDGAQELGLKETPSYYEDDEEEYEEEVEEALPEEGQIMKNDKDKKKEKKQKTKKPHRKIRILAVILAILLALPISYFGIYKGINYAMTHIKSEVPKVLGMSENEAKSTLTGKGFKVEVGELVVSANYEEGQVASQNPDPGSKLEKGSTVTINISRGPSSIVPDLIGKTQIEAEDILREHGFSVGDVSFEESSAQNNTVIRTYPGIGETAESGQAISLVISKGVNEVRATVPNLIGLTESAARSSLENVGLVTGDVTYEANSQHAEGTVTWQQYGAGRDVAGGTVISIKVSLGTPLDEGGGDSQE